jgi:isocitrate lyase
VTEGGNLLNLENEWRSNPRWGGVTRPYSASDVEKLRGSIQIEHTLARVGAERLWKLFQDEPHVFALGAVTGNQAIQQVRAGLQAVYVSGWQAAADANSAGQMYPDQSLYPVDTVPNLVRHINQSLIRADQIDRSEGNQETHWFAPIVADAEGGFGGNLNAFELMKAMIEAGAACVHFEDQLSTIKKVGRLGGNVLVPTGEAIQKLIAARLAADVLGVPTLVMARTDALTCFLLTSDIDPRDREFIPGKRTTEGYFRVRGGVKMAIARALAYAPYADVIWTETVKPDLSEAKEFAEGVLAIYPSKILAYNYAPSFNWRKNFDEEAMARLHTELAAMGYKFQFVTVAGFHALNESMFDLAHGFKQRGVAAYSSLQDAGFRNEEQNGYQGVNYQRFVGQAYFDAVQQIVTAGGAAAAAAIATAGSEASGGAGQGSEGKSVSQD